MYKQLDYSESSVKSALSEAMKQFNTLKNKPTGICWVASNGYTIIHNGAGVLRSTKQVICPYCGSHAHLVGKDEICGHGKPDVLVWACKPCNAYTSIHKNSGDKYRPMGRLANPELRGLRVRAHIIFDRLWRDKDSNARSQAYKTMQELFGITKKEAHISKLTEEQCVQLISFLQPKIDCNSTLSIT